MMHEEAPSLCAPLPGALAGDDPCPELVATIRKLEMSLKVHEHILQRLQGEHCPLTKVQHLLEVAFEKVCGADPLLASAVVSHLMKSPQKINTYRRILEDLGEVGGKSRLHSLLFRGLRQLAGKEDPKLPSLPFSPIRRNCGTYCVGE
jgi:hypothetical protein